MSCHYNFHGHHHGAPHVLHIFTLFLIFDTFLSEENWALTEIWIFITFSQNEILNLFWGLVLARDIKLMSPDLDLLIYHQNLEIPSKIGFSSKLEIKIKILISNKYSTVSYWSKHGLGPKLEIGVDEKNLQEAVQLFFIVASL